MKRILSVSIVSIVCMLYIHIKMINDYSKELNKESPNSLINISNFGSKLEEEEDETVDIGNEDMELFAKKLEVLLENSRFENITVQLGEKIICIYEGEHCFDLFNYKFAIYKETVDKNILFENMLYIEKDTGNIYTWEGEKRDNLTQIGQLKENEIELTKSFKKNKDTDLLYENTDIDQLMSGVFEALMHKEYVDLKLIYDGTTEFTNRKYHIISLFSEHEEHIIRTQSYYLDMENGNLYSVGENSIFLRMELYYETNIFEYNDMQSKTENIENRL